MNLRTVPTWRLREMITDTQAAPRPDQTALVILRREMERRELEQRPRPRKAVTHAR